MTEARPAATVVVMRQGRVGPEVLLLKRSRRAGFFPHAWVFPGGRVNPADAEARATGAVAGLAPELRAFAVAAVRETFEEAGVWLGQGTPPAGLRAALNARTATLLDAPGLQADLDRLEQWSWWITPEVEPRRYDTRFFLALVQPQELASEDGVETVQSGWFQPDRAVRAARDGSLYMAPPTFRTLEELAPYRDLQAVRAAARARPVGPIEPILLSEGLETPGALMELVLPGDPSHPEPPVVPGPRRIALVEGGWRSVR